MRNFLQVIFCLLFTMSVVAQKVVAHAYINEAVSVNTGRPLTVAVASNFKYTLEKIIASSTYWSNQNIRLVTASSGVLYAQIIKGAPYDVFLSADSQRPNNLIQAGLGTSSHIYAIGRLVMWPVYPSSISVEKPQNLAASYFTHLTNFNGKLAIANPQLAPFGRAALEVIESLPVVNDLSHQLVKGANVNQAFQFVDSGNAQAGLVSESLLIQANQLLGTDKYHHYILIPKSQYSNIEQSIVILKSSNVHPQSEPFVIFLLSEHAQSLLPQYGYDRP